MYISIEALKLYPNEFNLLAGGTEIPLLCSSDDILLACNPSPGSEHLLLALAPNEQEGDASRFSSPVNWTWDHLGAEPNPRVSACLWPQHSAPEMHFCLAVPDSNNPKTEARNDGKWMAIVMLDV